MSLEHFITCFLIYHSTCHRSCECLYHCYRVIIVYCYCVVIYMCDERFRNISRILAVFLFCRVTVSTALHGQSQVSFILTLALLPPVYLSNYAALLSFLLCFPSLAFLSCVVLSIFIAYFSPQHRRCCLPFSALFCPCQRSCTRCYVFHEFVFESCSSL